MALATTRVAINPTTPTLIASNVTSVSVTEYLVGNVRAYICPTGDTAPTIGSPYVEYEGSATVTPSAAFDIYMWTVSDTTTIGVLSE